MNEESFALRTKIDPRKIEVGPTEIIDPKWEEYNTEDTIYTVETEIIEL
jgi:hypothetical protein